MLEALALAKQSFLETPVILQNKILTACCTEQEQTGWKDRAVLLLLLCDSSVTSVPILLTHSTIKRNKILNVIMVSCLTTGGGV